MENLSLPPVLPHLRDNLNITLHDKRGRLIWTTDASSSDAPYYGMEAAKTIAECDREEWHKQLQRCVVDGIVGRYTVKALPMLSQQSHDAGPIVMYRGVMLPIDNDVSQVAVCTVASILPENFDDFTPQDIQVLTLLSNDTTLKQICKQLKLSSSTVDARVKRIKAKLECKTIAGAVAKAIRFRLI